ncbi:MAG TPA: TolC family protein [Chitinophagaceae bacterium]|nr:TolC family protein [Chitinophagaceae bacterium]
MKSLLNKGFIHALPLICGSFAAGIAAAQQPLSLGRAVMLAIDHYPSVQSRQAQVSAGKAVLEETRHAWLPSLRLHEQLDAGTDNSLNSAYFPVGIIPSASGGRRPDNNSSITTGNIAALAGDWEVYNFGSYKARTAEAGAALRISEAGLDREKYTITATVIQNYLDLVKYASLLALQQKNIQRTDTVKRAIQAYINSGLKAGVDSSVAEAELSKARLIYIEWTNAYNLLKSRLATLTGLDTAAVVPDTSINMYLRGLLAPAATPVDTFYRQHPFLKYYQSVYEDNLAQQQVIRKALLPKVSLMAAGWMRGSGISPSDVYSKNLLDGFGYSRYNYLVGVGITYNLFDLKRTQYRVNIQKFRTMAAGQDVQEQKTLLDNALQQADITVGSVVQKLREIPLQVKAAGDAYGQKLALYNAGITSIVDVTNALYVLNRAETDAVYTNDDAWKAIFQKAYAGNTISTLLSTLK